MLASLMLSGRVLFLFHTSNLVPCFDRVSRFMFMDFISNKDFNLHLLPLQSRYVTQSSKIQLLCIHVYFNAGYHLCDLKVKL